MQTMVKNRSIQIRLSKEELEQIKQNAQRRGFYSLSTFLRHLAIDNDFVSAQKLNEIHKVIVREQSGQEQMQKKI